jgi:hypothetical protein
VLQQNFDIYFDLVLFNTYVIIKILVIQTNKNIQGLMQPSNLIAHKIILILGKDPVKRHFTVEENLHCHDFDCAKKLGILTIIQNY